MSKLPRIDYVWTHRKKGGRYTITSFTTGAGKMRGDTLVHYRRIAAGGVGPVFSRLLSEWDDSMEPAME